jgi:MFS family permease
LILQNKAIFTSYSSSFFYNICLGMMNILVPLYAIYLGFNAFQVGLVVSAQGFFQFLLRLFGGILSDRFGELWVMRFSFTLTALGGLILVSDNIGFSLLIAAQLLSGASRAVYWAASQSYASRIDPSRMAKILGTLSGFVNGATFVGTLMSGLIIVIFSYSVAFWIVALSGAIALFISFIMPHLPSATAKKGNSANVLQSIPNMLRRKFVYLGAIPSFIAGMSIALLASIYPVYYDQIGFGEAAISVFSSLRAVGMTISGFLFGFLMARFSQQKLYALAAGGMGTMIVISPYMTSEWTIVTIVTLLGMFAGLGNVIYQMIVTSNSLPEERGLALSTTGLFWAFSQLVIPTIFGFLVTRIGFPFSFAMGGGLLILIALATPMLYRKWGDQPIEHESVREP